MRFGAKRVGREGAAGRWKRRLLGIATMSLILSLAGGVAAAAPLATPTHRAPSGGYDELWVPSSMGPIKVQVQWAARGGNAALYLLDGLRARSDRNAWSFETNALQQFANDNVTLVMPVGGQSSFYTDWYSPSNFNGQPITYKWETFLTQELPAFLEGYGVSRTNNAVAGLSMGGSAALTLAAYHRDQFRYAAAYSGYLSLSAPGMRSAIRIAMLDAGGYNVDNMWGPPWDPAWLRNDPFVFAPRLAGLPMYVSAGLGIPGPPDAPTSLVGAYNTSNAMALEALAQVNTRAFQIRLATLGIPAQFEFPIVGTHSWAYWEGELWKSRGPILDALNAH